MLIFPPLQMPSNHVLTYLPQLNECIIWNYGVLSPQLSDRLPKEHPGAAEESVEDPSVQSERRQRLLVVDTRTSVGDNRTEAILDNGGTASRHSHPSITGWMPEDQQDVEISKNGVG